jgi:branched-chain amino acid transport system substrate-binding protein
MHTAARVAVLLLLAPLALGGCAGRRPMAAVAGAGRVLSHREAHGVKAPAVAIVSSQTGSVASLDVPAERGALLAFERHAARAGTAAAGPAPETRVFDTASTTDGASRASAAARAAWGAGSATPVVALGLCDTDLALAAVPAFSKAGVPFVVVGATAPDLPARCGEGTFLACFGDDAQGRAAADFVHARFGTRLAIVFDSRSVYARTVAGFCRDRFREQGGTVAMEFDLAATPAVQVGAFMAGLQDKADAIYVACEPGDVAPVLASVRPVLPSIPIVAGDAFDCDAASTSGGQPTSRVWFTTHAWFGAGASPEAAAFAEAYRARWGEAPSGFAALGFDAANVVLAALDRAHAAGKGGDPAAVRAEVAATRGFAGASGTIDFARGPVPAKDVWVVEVSAGTRALASRVPPAR